MQVLASLAVFLPISCSPAELPPGKGMICKNTETIKFYSSNFLRDLPKFCQSSELWILSIHIMWQAVRGRVKISAKKDQLRVKWSIYRILVEKENQGLRDFFKFLLLLFLETENMWKETTESSFKVVGGLMSSLDHTHGKTTHYPSELLHQPSQRNF